MPEPTPANSPPPEDATRRASGDLDPAPEPTPGSGPLAPEASAPRQRRPWTILGRLSRAIREQNWFAVALELCIVVLGVVIGFQVTSWGQDRTDRKREQTYLNEIRRDLIETETSLETAIETMGFTRDATSSLIRSAYEPDAVDRDSLAVWIFEAQYIGIPTYRMGTARALVETGDLQLIRDDSTRIAISRLVDDFQRSYAMQQSLLGLILPGLVGLRKRTAATDLYTDLAPLSSRVRRRDEVVNYIESHVEAIPAGGQLSFADDYADLLNDAETFRDWRDTSDHLLVTQVQYRLVLEMVQRALQQVEAELNR